MNFRRISPGGVRRARFSPSAVYVPGIVGIESEKMGSLGSIGVEEVMFCLLDCLLDASEEDAEAIQDSVLKFATLQPDYTVKSILYFLQVQQTTAAHQLSLLGVMETCISKSSDALSDGLVKEVLVFMMKELNVIYTTDPRHQKMLEVINVTGVLCPDFTMELILSFLEELRIHSASSSTSHEAMCTLIGILTCLFDKVPQTPYFTSPMVLTKLLSLYDPSTVQSKNVELCKALIHILFTISNLITSPQSDFAPETPLEMPCAMDLHDTCSTRFTAAHAKFLEFQTCRLAPRQVKRLIRIHSVSNLPEAESVCDDELLLSVSRSNYIYYSKLQISTPVQVSIRSLAGKVPGTHNFEYPSTASSISGSQDLLGHDVPCLLPRSNLTITQESSKNSPALADINLDKLLAPIYRLMLDDFLPQVYTLPCYNVACMELLYALAVLLSVVDDNTVDAFGASILDALLVRVCNYVPSITYKQPPGSCDRWISLYRASSGMFTSKIASIFSSIGYPMDRAVMLPPPIYVYGLRLTVQALVKLRPYILVKQIYNLCDVLFGLLVGFLGCGKECFYSCLERLDCNFDVCKSKTNLPGEVAALLDTYNLDECLDFMRQLILTYRLLMSSLGCSLYMFESVFKRLSSSQEKEMTVALLVLSWLYATKGLLSALVKTKGNRHPWAMARATGATCKAWRLIIELDKVVAGFSNESSALSIRLVLSLVNHLSKGEWLTFHCVASSGLGAFSDKHLGQENICSGFEISSAVKKLLSLVVELKITHDIEERLVQNCRLYPTAEYKDMNTNFWRKLYGMRDLGNIDKGIFVAASDSMVSYLMVCSGEVLLVYLVRIILRGYKAPMLTLLRYIEILLSWDISHAALRLVHTNDLLRTLAIVLVYLHDPLNYLGETFYASKLLLQLYKQLGISLDAIEFVTWPCTKGLDSYIFQREAIDEDTGDSPLILVDVDAAARPGETTACKIKTSLDTVGASRVLVHFEAASKAMEPLADVSLLQKQILLEQLHNLAKTPLPVYTFTLPRAVSAPMGLTHYHVLGMFNIVCVLGRDSLAICGALVDVLFGITPQKSATTATTTATMAIATATANGNGAVANAVASVVNADPIGTSASAGKRSDVATMQDDEKPQDPRKLDYFCANLVQWNTLLLASNVTTDDVLSITAILMRVAREEAANCKQANLSGIMATGKIPNSLIHHPNLFFISNITEALQEEQACLKSFIIASLGRWHFERVLAKCYNCLLSHVPKGSISFSIFGKPTSVAFAERVRTVAVGALAYLYPLTPQKYMNTCIEDIYNINACVNNAPINSYFTQDLVKSLSKGIEEHLEALSKPIDFVKTNARFSSAFSDIDDTAESIGSDDVVLYKCILSPMIFLLNNETDSLVQLGLIRSFITLVSKAHKVGTILPLQRLLVALNRLLYFLFNPNLREFGAKLTHSELLLIEKHYADVFSHYARTCTNIYDAAILPDATPSESLPTIQSKGDECSNVSFGTAILLGLCSTVMHGHVMSCLAPHSILHVIVCFGDYYYGHILSKTLDAEAHMFDHYESCGISTLTYYYLAKVLGSFDWDKYAKLLLVLLHTPSKMNKMHTKHRLLAALTLIKHTNFTMDRNNVHPGWVHILLLLWAHLLSLEATDVYLATNLTSQIYRLIYGGCRLTRDCTLGNGNTRKWIDRILPSSCLVTCIICCINFLESGGSLVNSFAKILHRILMNRYNELDARRFACIVATVFKRFGNVLLTSDVPLFLRLFVIDLAKADLDSLCRSIFSCNRGYSKQFQMALVKLLTSDLFLLEQLLILFQEWLLMHPKTASLEFDLDFILNFVNEIYLTDSTCKQCGVVSGQAGRFIVALTIRLLYTVNNGCSPELQASITKTCQAITDFAQVDYTVTGGSNGDENGPLSCLNLPNFAPLFLEQLLQLLRRLETIEDKLASITLRIFCWLLKHKRLLHYDLSVACVMATIMDDDKRHPLRHDILYTYLCNCRCVALNIYKRAIFAKNLLKSDAEKGLNDQRCRAMAIVCNRQAFLESLCKIVTESFKSTQPSTHKKQRLATALIHHALQQRIHCKRRKYATSVMVACESRVKNLIYGRSAEGCNKHIARLVIWLLENNAFANYKSPKEIEAAFQLFMALAKWLRYRHGRLVAISRRHKLHFVEPMGLALLFGTSSPRLSHVATKFIKVCFSMFQDVSLAQVIEADTNKSAPGADGGAAASILDRVSTARALSVLLLNVPCKAKESTCFCGCNNAALEHTNKSRLCIKLAFYLLELASSCFPKECWNIDVGTQEHIQEELERMKRSEFHKRSHQVLFGDINLAHMDSKDKENLVLSSTRMVTGDDLYILDAIFDLNLRGDDYTLATFLGPETNISNVEYDEAVDTSASPDTSAAATPLRHSGSAARQLQLQQPPSAPVQGNTRVAPVVNLLKILDIADYKIDNEQHLGRINLYKRSLDTLLLDAVPRNASFLDIATLENISHTTLFTSPTIYRFILLNKYLKRKRLFEQVTGIDNVAREVLLPCINLSVVLIQVAAASLADESKLLVRFIKEQWPRCFFALVRYNAILHLEALAGSTTRQLCKMLEMPMDYKGHIFKHMAAFATIRADSSMF